MEWLLVVGLLAGMGLVMEVERFVGLGRGGESWETIAKTLVERAIAQIERIVFRVLGEASTVIRILFGMSRAPL